MILELILLGSVIGIIEGIPLVKKKLWKELASIIFLISIAILLGTIDVLDMPKPIHTLNDLIYPFGKKVFRHE